MRGLTRADGGWTLVGVAATALGLIWFKTSTALGGVALFARRLGLLLGNFGCRFWSLLPMPVSELVWIMGPLAFVAVAVRMCRRRGVWGFAGALCRLTAAGGVIVLIFSAVFLVQYSAPPLAEELSMTVNKYTVEELADVAGRVAAELNAYADKVERDDNGLFAPKGYDGLAQAVLKSFREGSMATLYRRGAGVAPKQALLLSKAMSMLNLTGYYFPLTGESIVSRDIIETSIPFTIAHEEAHSMGVGPEKEANFAAFLCCIQSEDPELCYSGLFNGYIYLNNALYNTHRELWEQTYSLLSQPVREDLSAKSAHLSKYQGPVNDFGSAVNDGFIKATGQPEGIESYGLVTDMIIAYYLEQ